VEDEAKKKRRKRDVNYYASRAMSKAERMELIKAAEVSGLGHEIALLRSKLKKAVERSQNGDGGRRAMREVRALTEALHVLLKAVAVEHKVTPLKKDSLAESLQGTLQILGDFILPAERRGGDEE
jgi:hypothetical protein